MNHHLKQIGALLVAFALLAPGQTLAVSWGKKDKPEEKRAEIQQMKQETLERLYQEKPETQEMVSRATGYAVFSNFGMNLFLVSTANGKGVAHDNTSGKDTYMNMFSAGAGVGMGVKSYSAVFIFHNRDVFDQFVEKGWDFSGQADAAATTDAGKKQEAGALSEGASVVQGVSVYQLTDKGLALQATLQGTKYWQDDDLND